MKNNDINDLGVFLSFDLLTAVGALAGCDQRGKNRLFVDRMPSLLITCERLGWDNVLPGDQEQLKEIIGQFAARSSEDVQAFIDCLLMPIGQVVIKQHHHLMRILMGSFVVLSGNQGGRQSAILTGMLRYPQDDRYFQHVSNDDLLKFLGTFAHDHQRIKHQLPDHPQSLYHFIINLVKIALARMMPTESAILLKHVAKLMLSSEWIEVFHASPVIVIYFQHGLLLDTGNTSALSLQSALCLMALRPKRPHDLNQHDRIAFVLANSVATVEADPLGFIEVLTALTHCLQDRPTLLSTTVNTLVKALLPLKTNRSSDVHRLMTQIYMLLVAQGHCTDWVAWQVAKHTASFLRLDQLSALQASGQLWQYAGDHCVAHLVSMLEHQELYKVAAIFLCDSGIFRYQNLFGQHQVDWLDRAIEALKKHTSDQGAFSVDDFYIHVTLLCLAGLPKGLERMLQTRGFVQSLLTSSAAKVSYPGVVLVAKLLSNDSQKVLPFCQKRLFSMQEILIISMRTVSEKERLIISRAMATLTTVMHQCLSPRHLKQSNQQQVLLQLYAEESQLEVRQVLAESLLQYERLNDKSTMYRTKKEELLFTLIGYGHASFAEQELFCRWSYHMARYKKMGLVFSKDARLRNVLQGVFQQGTVEVKVAALAAMVRLTVHDVSIKNFLLSQGKTVLMECLTTAVAHSPMAKRMAIVCFLSFSETKHRMLLGSCYDVLYNHFMYNVEILEERQQLTHTCSDLPENTALSVNSQNYWAGKRLRDGVEQSPPKRQCLTMEDGSSKSLAVSQVHA